MWSQINSKDLFYFHYLSGGWAPSRLRDHTCSVYRWHACHTAGFNPDGAGRSCHTQVTCLHKKDVEHTGSKILHCGRPQECMSYKMCYLRHFSFKKQVLLVYITHNSVSQCCKLFTLKHLFSLHTSFEVLDWFFFLIASFPTSVPYDHFHAASDGNFSITQNTITACVGITEEWVLHMNFDLTAE